MADKTEAMVLQDGDGAYYAIPLEEVEAYRVADDKQGAVGEAVGNEEVAAFNVLPVIRQLDLKKGKGLAFSGSLKVVGSFSLDVGVASRPSRPEVSLPHR